MRYDERKLDEALLREFCGGRRAALGELAQRHESSLLGLAAAMLGGQRELACDAVQEMWLRVIRFGASFNGRSSVKTWLYRVLLSRCRDLAEERAAGTEVAVRSNSAPAAENMPTRTAVGMAPSDGAIAEERDGVLRAAVGRLGEEQKAIVLLCYHEALTHEQAAEILEIPLGTLKSRLHASLQALRADVGGMDLT